MYYSDFTDQNRFLRVLVCKEHSSHLRIVFIPFRIVAIIEFGLYAGLVCSPGGTGDTPEETFGISVVLETVATGVVHLWNKCLACVTLVLQRRFRTVALM